MAHYRVEVAGEIGTRFGETFEVLDVETRAGHTILILELEDQAALHGLFEMLESIGIELVAVNPAHLPPPAREGDPSPG